MDILASCIQMKANEQTRSKGKLLGESPKKIRKVIISRIISELLGLIFLND